jgi:hypothetical protein
MNAQRGVVKRPCNTAALAATVAAALTFVGCTSEELSITNGLGVGEPVTLVTDFRALQALEGRGFSFAERFAHDGSFPGETLRLTSAEALWSQSSLYRSLGRYIALDITGSEDGEPNNAIPGIDNSIAHYESKGLGGFGKRVGWADTLFKVFTAREQGWGFQLFNPAWLRSKEVHFELEAVVNRFDRRHHPERAATCGELRLIYRAAYEGKAREDYQQESELPLTLVLVYPQPGEDCLQAANAWLSPGLESPEEIATFLADGPLSHVDGVPISVELNVQTDLWSRFVHGIEGDFVARHHEYVLRVFTPVEKDGAWALEPSLLDNTPAAELIAATPSLRQELLDWIAGNLDEIDDGSALLPQKFLATQVRSVSGLGLQRPVNRPFSQALLDNTPQKVGGDYGLLATRIAASDLEGRENIGTYPALLRRLDSMSCSGCHQARSILGFHLLGETSSPNRIANAAAVPVSAHLRDEMLRRADDLKTYLAQESDGLPGPILAPMPMVERGYSPALQGVWGAPCGLGDPGFADMTCGDGLVCRDLSGDHLGQCANERAIAGDACENLDYYASAYDPHLERARTGTWQPDSSCLCVGRLGGFPHGGSCTGPVCERSGDPRSSPDHICGVMPIGEPFGELWGYVPADELYEGATFLASQRACDIDHPCRDEFVCARTKARGPGAEERGQCLPGYMMMSLEIDAHAIVVPPDAPKASNR